MNKLAIRKEIAARRPENHLSDLTSKSGTIQSHLDKIVLKVLKS